MVLRFGIEEDHSIPLTRQAVHIGKCLGFIIPSKYYELKKGELYEVRIRRLTNNENK